MICGRIERVIRGRGEVRGAREEERL